MTSYKYKCVYCQNPNQYKEFLKHLHSIVFAISQSATPKRNPMF